MTSDRELPPGDRSEQPDPPAPTRETFSEKLQRLARENHPKLMAEADALAAKEARLRRKPRADDGLQPLTGARERQPGEDG